MEHWEPSDGRRASLSDAAAFRAKCLSQINKLRILEIRLQPTPCQWVYLDRHRNAHFGAEILKILAKSGNSSDHAQFIIAVANVIPESQACSR